MQGASLSIYRYLHLALKICLKFFLFKKTSTFVEQLLYLFFSMLEVKQQFLETAFRLFLQDSYKAVTLRDIIKESGLSNGSFYHYFDSKEQLFKEVIQTFLIDLSHNVNCNHEDDSLWQFIQCRIGKIQNTYLRLEEIIGDINEASIYSLTFEAVRHFPEIKEESMQNQTLEMQCWIDILCKAKHIGEIQSDLDNETLARFFIYVQDGDNMNRFIFNADHKQLIDRLKVMWEGLYHTLKSR